MNKKLVVEFIGTFFLVLTIALTGNPLAIGVVLAAAVYMGGYISGAHYNPAVTLALWVNKKIGRTEAMQYIITQIFAGATAAMIYMLITGWKFLPLMNDQTTVLAAVLVEVLFTFLLASVVLHTAATDKTKGNSYYGLAIGFTLLAAAYAGGPISGGAFNPAVGVGPLILDVGNLNAHMNSLLLYLLAPSAGGIAAGLVYKATR